MSREAFDQDTTVQGANALVPWTRGADFRWLPGCKRGNDWQFNVVFFPKASTTAATEAFNNSFVSCPGAEGGLAHSPVLSEDSAWRAQEDPE